MYPLRAEKPCLHPNFTCVHGDRRCRNPFPGDVAETRGFAVSVPKGKQVKKPRATHCTDGAQTSGNMTPTVESCPPHPTFRTKVRARRYVPEEKKMDNYTRTYLYTSYFIVGKVVTAFRPSKGNSVGTRRFSAVFMGSHVRPFFVHCRRHPTHPVSILILYAI